MRRDSKLTEKKNELKQEITVGMNSLLMGLIFDRTSRTIQKITRKSLPPSFYYTVIVVELVIPIPGLFITILLDESRQFAKWGTTWLVGLEISLACVVAAKLTMGHILANLRDHIMDAIQSVRDLADFQKWLEDIWAPWKPASFAIVWGLASSTLFLTVVSVLSGEFVGLGFAVSSCLVGIFFWVVVYHMLQMLVLPSRLSKYQFELYEANPRDSEVIRHLARVLNRYAYILAPLVTLVTLFFASNSSTSWFNIVILLVGWIPLTLQFISNQSAMTSIIANAKGKYLKTIEQKIKMIQARADLADTETMESINRLMDFHERVSATRDSTLDLRAGLSFLNQLLLPLLAFVIANLDNLRKLFR